MPLLLYHMATDQEVEERGKANSLCMKGGWRGWDPLTYLIASEGAELADNFDMRGQEFK